MKIETKEVKNDFPAIFVDWFTAGQRHPLGGIPPVVGGVAARFDSAGVCLFERIIPARFSGSYETSVGVSCDGSYIGISGNVGRFGREDNLFNLGWSATVDKASRILAAASLPALSVGVPRPVVAVGLPDNGRGWEGRGATLARVDLTCNYATGSESQAKAVIRWLASQSIKRAKRGYSGDESVWWSNTRYMLKAYRKGAEMRAHGSDSQLAQWASDLGIVRVELELKRRELDTLGLRDIGDVTQEKLEAIFRDHCESFSRLDSSDEPDIIANVPVRSRAYAAAWLAGQDCRVLCSQATLYRHAKVLREYGLDILEPRNIQQFPVKVRVIDLEPCTIPDWYLERLKA